MEITGTADTIRRIWAFSFGGITITHRWRDLKLNRHYLLGFGGGRVGVGVGRGGGDGGYDKFDRLGE
ncbi:MAG: hypothetical protein UX38_C0004G0063 [Microgenomates group bacterium GW2011_GWC1_46_16]|nr:MAG: hypothetical protein UX38_C0004G0063 [Microgenomates group bacterium GW2011_GWC1_46_16]